MTPASPNHDPVDGIERSLDLLAFVVIRWCICSRFEQILKRKNHCTISYCCNMKSIDSHRDENRCKIESVILSEEIMGAKKLLVGYSVSKKQEDQTIYSTKHW
jgi:hypothetical protein